MRLSILANSERGHLLAALCASLAAVLLDNWAAPALHNHSPFWALGFLLALLCRSARGEFAWEPAVRWQWSRTRAALFVALHGGIIVHFTSGVSKRGATQHQRQIEQAMHMLTRSTRTSRWAHAPKGHRNAISVLQRS